MKDLPKGAWARARTMTGLAIKVAGKELARRVRGSAEAAAALETRIEQAKLVAKSLSRMKGAAMKAGQLLSIDAGDLLPPEVAEVLAKLQSDAEPIDFPPMREVVRDDLGPEKLGRLVGLGAEPPASASIGQVYRAFVDGAPVAVKVQYPGVAESIDSDLALLAKLGQGVLTLSGRKVPLDELMAELSRVLHYETDYVRERGHLEYFASALAGDPRFIVPVTHPDLCSRRVLTMSWEEGEPLQAWMRRPQSAARREALGRAALDLFCIELFTLGLVQTDPNFGNFLVRGDEPRLVLLDFGATLAYDEAFRGAYARLVSSMVDGSPERIIDESVAFGLLDPRESAETRTAFVDLLVAAIAPLISDVQPFAFDDASYAKRLQELGERFARSVRYSPPPKNLVFLHRKLGGLYQLLRRLDLSLDLRPFLDRLLQAAA